MLAAQVTSVTPPVTLGKWLDSRGLQVSSYSYKQKRTARSKAGLTSAVGGSMESMRQSDPPPRPARTVPDLVSSPMNCCAVNTLH